MRILSKDRGKKGVTLIELAVVMAIVAIMALFMAPAIGEWLDNFRIRQTARDIASTLQLAKMQTISTRQSHSVSFDTTNETYQLSPGGNLTQVPRGIDIVSGSTIAFRADGTSTSSGTITIDNAKGKEYEVSISTTGRIQIQGK